MREFIRKHLKPLIIKQWADLFPGRSLAIFFDEEKHMENIRTGLIEGIRSLQVQELTKLYHYGNRPICISLAFRIDSQSISSHTFYESFNDYKK